MQAMPHGSPDRMVTRHPGPEARVAWRSLIPLCLLVVCQIGSAGDGWYRPASGASWQWQLEGRINRGYAATIYDIDLFTTPMETLRALRDQGHRLICYFSAGTWEPYRPDRRSFPPDAIGKAMRDWPDERWLDIRSAKVRAALLARLDLARDKGCDGVEPDNVDAYSNDSGFALTPADQLDFNRFLAREAHARALAVGLKNDLDQIPDLAADFDFALNEQCHQYRECGALEPFTKAGKAVLNAEYDKRHLGRPKARSAMCRRSRELGLSTLVLPLALDDSFRFSCATDE